MRTISILRTACVALLLLAGLPSAQAQGIRVHYKNGTTVDISAALFDHMSPGYQKKTTGDDDPVNPDNPDDNKGDIKVDPLDVNSPFVNILKDAGMPIYTGSSYPTLNGTFSLRPPKLVKYWSNNPDDYNDLDELVDNAELVFKFSGQSGNNVFVDMYAVDEEGADYSISTSMYQDSQGIKAHVTGSGNKFTIGFVVTTEIPMWNLFIRLAYVMSGEVSGNSVKNLYIAEASLDENNQIEEYAIATDADGTSITTTWSPKPKTDSRKGSRLTRRLMPKKTIVEIINDEYYYTIYKTDGTQLKVTQDELDYVETYEAAFDDRITQQIPQEYLSKMATYMPIYAGNTPPSVDGTFISHPYELIFASDNYKSDKGFGDQTMNFSGQDKSKNTIFYQYRQGAGSSEKTEMVIMGEGDKFTIFAIMNGNNASNNATYKMAEIVSGTMTADGIRDLYSGILMIEKNDPGNNLISVGTYRIFTDGDGLASPSSWSARSTVREQAGANNTDAK